LNFYGTINKKNIINDAILKANRNRKESYYEMIGFNKYFKEHNLKFDPVNNCWVGIEGHNILGEPNLVTSISEKSEYRWNRIFKSWIDEKGNSMMSSSSDNLRLEIEKTFGVIVKEKNWQHWNGGLFLFNADSLSFLKIWRDWTIEVFNLKRHLTYL